MYLRCAGAPGASRVYVPADRGSAGLLFGRHGAVEGKFNFIHVFTCMHAHMITYLMVCILTGEGRRQPGPDSQPEAADSCSAGG